MNILKRCQQVAQRLSRKHGVHVEYLGIGNGYAVEGRHVYTALAADTAAKKIAQALEVYHAP